MVLKIDFKKFIKNISIPLTLGLISAFLTKNGVEYFSAKVAKPSFAPPDQLFPIVWSILYVLMGVASYLVDTSNYSPSKTKGQILFYVQLLFNFCWSFIFFNVQAYFISLLWIIIMLGLIIATTIIFYKINRFSAYLMIPYILWVSFATILTGGIWSLN